MNGIGEKVQICYEACIIFDKYKKQWTVPVGEIVQVVVIKRENRVGVEVLAEKQIHHDVLPLEAAAAMVVV